jgi:hypothetical protein
MRLFAIGVVIFIPLIIGEYLLYTPDAVNRIHAYRETHQNPYQDLFHQLDVMNKGGTPAPGSNTPMPTIGYPLPYYGCELEVDGYLSQPRFIVSGLIMDLLACLAVATLLVAIPAALLSNRRT